MALRFGHRISYDVDIFLHDAQILGYLSPRLNDLSGSLADSYTEAANGIKITTGRGDIDFVVAADVTRDEPVLAPVPGMALNILVQSPAEILAKKLQYRGFKFTHRDIFDLAMLLENDPASVDGAVKACSAVEVDKAVGIMRSRLGRLAIEVPDYVNPTPAFEPLGGRLDEVIGAFVSRFSPLTKPQGRGQL